MSNTDKALDEILEQFRNCILDNNGESLDEIDTLQQIQALIDTAVIKEIKWLQKNCRTTIAGFEIDDLDDKLVNDRLKQLKKKEG